MQLAEYVIWINQDGCNLYNRIASSIVPILLILQAILAPVVVWYFGAGYGTLYIPIVFTTLIIAPFVLYEFYKQGAFSKCLQTGDAGHLAWNLPNIVAGIRYHLVILYTLYTLKNRTLSVAFSTFYILSFAYNKYKYDRVWASTWCHFVNAMALLAPFA